MDREQIAFAALRPADAMMGLAVEALERTGKLQSMSDPVYAQLRGVLRKLFESQNDLEVIGAENVPDSGGFILASNHQSWDDVQVLGVASPRRLRFLAKSEFESWPVLRHLIRLTDSPFIRRGGDREGIERAVETLREGKVLCIFPEGTIPGEEDIPRHMVDPETGLLPGKTGAVRLSMAADVPIVPVGISGAGAAFPPEIYPRLELLEPPRKAPITVRFGTPIRFPRPDGGVADRESLKESTRTLMRAISALVDHGRNYIPIQVPIEPLPRYERLGVLLLHGFTSSLRTVSDLVPHLERAGIRYRMPILRGHGTEWQDLRGVTARDWYEDAETALLELADEVDRVVVVGLSMGGLLALELGMRHPDRVAAVVPVAAALRFRDPMSRLTPVLAKLVKSWPSPESFNDPGLRERGENYPRFATDAFGSLYQYARDLEARLPELRVPVCVLQSKRDQVVAPVSANVIYEKVSSSHREIHWFERSGHEMMQDLEADQVFATIMDYVAKLRAEAKD